MVEFGRTSGSPENEDFDLEFEGAFEQELRAGLRPRSAPEGFADRVLARIEKVPERTPVLRAIQKPMVRGAIAAALLLALGTGAYIEHQRERQIAGEHARQQVLLALRITSSTLQDVRNKVDKN
ncbi:MAG: hypothetical protein ACLQMO_15795 [Acidobacteriaceae bacterium]